jgi:hypothetical protein
LKINHLATLAFGFLFIVHCSFVCRHY